MNGLEPTAIVLPPSLDLLGAEPLCRQLRTKVLSGEAVIVDGGQVERIATACVQVLVAAAKSAQSRSLSFRLLTPSTALTGALSDLGLADELNGQDS